MDKDRTSFKNLEQDLEPALSELFGSLDAAQLEKITIHAIKEHRCLFNLPEDTCEAMNSVQDASQKPASERRQTFESVMLYSKAQMAVVAFLIERLGYIPDIPDDAEYPRDANSMSLN